MFIVWTVISVALFLIMWPVGIASLVIELICWIILRIKKNRGRES